MKKNKFEERMNNLSKNMERQGRCAEKSKLYNAIQEKMLNLNKTIEK